MAKRGRKPRSSVNQVDESLLMNMETLNYYKNYLYELTLNSVIWEGLPESVNPQFLEQTLIEKGYVLFFEDEYLGYLGLTCTIGGELDVYRIPIFRQAFSTTGYVKDCTIEDSVLIFNNALHTPDIQVIDMFARRLTVADRAVDVNINNQKFPLLITAPPEQELSLKNVYMQVDGNCPAIHVNKNFDPESIQVLQTNMPFVADKIIYSRNQIMNQFLTWLGAENSNQDKKERLVSNEVGSNYGNVELSRNTRINAREYGARLVNSMFGLDIHPRFNSDIATMLNMGRDAWEVNSNEPLYNSDPLDSRNGNAKRERNTVASEN